MITVREACEHDSENILKWRNHQIVRMNSFNHSEITAAEHDVWFSQALQSEKKIIYIGLFHEKEIGVVSFYLNNDDTCDVNIYLNQVYSGNNYGGKMLLAGINRLIKTHYNIATIKAEIMPENIPSIRMFERQGFKKKGKGYIYTL